VRTHHFPQLLGRRIVLRFFAHKLDDVRKWTQSYEESIAVKMIFLRLFPFTPNWWVATPPAMCLIVLCHSSILLCRCCALLGCKLVFFGV